MSEPSSAVDAGSNRSGGAPVISILPPDVAARIAAGEVVERPASVVKELVENSLDAGALRVDVLIEAGGLERIRVSDDGRGIASGQVDLAFARHGTSKLRYDGELARLTTLGFRGEALPGIAAVAEVECQTRASVEEIGVDVRLRAGRIVERRPVARQSGTTMTVLGLFEDLPVRRRFLRSQQAEAALASQVAGHLALARPDVAIRVVCDGRQVFATPGDGSLRTTAGAIRGLSFVRGAHDLGPVDIASAGGRHLARVFGLLGGSSEQRGNRGGLSLFVNGRWVQNRVLTRAIEDGYQTMIRAGRHPAAIVFLVVPPEHVDVNVHPAKSEVRLIAESELFVRLRSIVEGALPLAQQLWPGDTDEGEAAGLGLATEELRVLGHVGATYVVAEGGLGLYLVDQHAAHERILLDQLCDRLTARSRQQLLVPEILELPASSSLDVEQVSDALGELGFDAEPFGAASVLVRACPAALAERLVIGAIEQAVATAAAQPGARNWRHGLAVEVACRSAIKAGDGLSTDEMLALVRQLGETRLGETCAHGRPTSLLLSHDQLARRFGRS